MDKAIWLEMRTRLNWQHYFGLARQSNNKCIVAKDVFWKKDKFNIGFDYGITRKACITDLSDHPSLGYGRGRKKTHFNWSTVSTSLHVLPKEFTNFYLSVTCEQTILQSSPYIYDIIWQNGLVLCSQTGYTIKEAFTEW